LHPGPWALAALLSLAASACNARVVQEHYIPASSWGTGQSGSDLRVRVGTNASDCAIGQLAQSQVVSNAVGGIVEEQVRRELALREVLVASRASAAASTGRELELAMGAFERGGAAGASEADTLRVLNVVCKGLGAPHSFTTVPEARAFLDRAAVE
jgi:hypothetical protein